MRDRTPRARGGPVSSGRLAADESVPGDGRAEIADILVHLAAARLALDKVAALDLHNALAEQIRGHMIQGSGRMSDALVAFRAAVPSLMVAAAVASGDAATIPGSAKSVK